MLTDGSTWSEQWRTHCSFENCFKAKFEAFLPQEDSKRVTITLVSGSFMCRLFLIECINFLLILPGLLFCCYIWILLWKFNLFESVFEHHQCTVQERTLVLKQPAQPSSLKLVLPCPHLGFSYSWFTISTFLCFCHSKLYKLLLF